METRLEDVVQCFPTKNCMDEFREYISKKIQRYTVFASENEDVTFPGIVGN